MKVSEMFHITFVFVAFPKNIPHQYVDMVYYSRVLNHE